MKIHIHINLNDKLVKLMSSSTSSACEPAYIETAANKNIKPPEIPIDSYLIEAMELYKWCQDDKEDLINAGINWNMVENIPALAYDLREAEAKWFSLKFKTAHILKRWKTVSRQGYMLRNIILHAMEYAYRHKPALMAEIISLKNGNGSTDLIQNLKDISIFGKKNSDLLSQINYDIHLLDEAADLAVILSSILASAKSEENNRDIKKERDEAYLLLKEAVDEVQSCGQFVFWKNTERLGGYKSSQNSIKSKYNYKYQIENAN